YHLNLLITMRRLASIDKSVAGRVGGAQTCQPHSYLLMRGAPGAEHPKRRILVAFPHLDDFIRFQAVSFSVDGGCCPLARSLNETENFATALIEPVLQVLNAMLFLRFQVRLVCVLYSIGS